MTDSEPNSSRTEKAAENSGHDFDRLTPQEGAAKVLKLLNNEFHPESTLYKLSTRYQLLFDEVRGIVEGMESGAIKVSQPKIIQNLLLILEEIERIDGPNHDHNELFLAARVAASYGLTLESNGVPLMPRRQKIHER